MKCISRVPQVTLMCGQNSPCTGDTGLDRGRFVPDVTPRIEDTGLLRPCHPFPGMLLLRSLFIGLDAQVHCFQLPSRVPHPRVVSGCPPPMAASAVPRPSLSLITVKQQPGSISLCLWSPQDETTVGTLALGSPVRPPWHGLVPWQAPSMRGERGRGGSGILWLLSCPWGGPRWPSLSVPGDRVAVKAQRPLLNLPVMERAGLKGAEMHFPAWSLCPGTCGFQSAHHWL